MFPQNNFIFPATLLKQFIRNPSKKLIPNLDKAITAKKMKKKQKKSTDKGIRKTTIFNKKVYPGKRKKYLKV